jgi:uncharacterized protein YndB with AHSA1/START domain
MSFIPLRPPTGELRPRRFKSNAGTSRRSVTAPQLRVWEVLEDPHHLPRWWPATARVEDVQGDRWTQVFMTKRGRPVRADYRLLVSERPWRRCWELEIEATPFERVLAQSVIEVVLEPVEGGTLVTLSQQQKLRGYSRTGALLLRRTTERRLGEALAGLERICVA